MSVQVSQEELADLSLACSKLWELDSDRLEPGRDYQLDLQVCGLPALIETHACSAQFFTYGVKYVHQVGKKSYQQEDVAAEAAFCFSERSSFAIQTYLCSLLQPARQL